MAQQAPETDKEQATAHKAAKQATETEITTILTQMETETAAETKKPARGSIQAMMPTLQRQITETAAEPAAEEALQIKKSALSAFLLFSNSQNLIYVDFFCLALDRNLANLDYINNMRNFCVSELTD